MRKLHNSPDNRMFRPRVLVRVGPPMAKTLFYRRLCETVSPARETIKQLAKDTVKLEEVLKQKDGNAYIFLLPTTDSKRLALELKIELLCSGSDAIVMDAGAPRQPMQPAREARDSEPAILA